MSSQSDEDLESAVIQLLALLKKLNENISTNSPYLGLNQTAAYLGRSESTVRRWVNEGVIHCYHVPLGQKSTMLFNRERLEEDLENFIH